MSRTKISADIFYKATLRLAVFVLVAAVLLASCATGVRRHEKGVKVVSWYGPGFHGKRTASGEKYNMYAMTCAHKTLPFGIKLKLKNIENGRTVIVVVNDRGPFVRGRDIDLSKTAAMRLGIIGTGTGRVRMKVVGRDMRYAQYIKSGKVSHSGKHYTAGRKAGPYTIQVAAFGEKESATYLLRGLKLNHTKAYMIEAWVDGKRFYRVRVGKFRSERSAESYARRLANEGYAVRVTPYKM